MIDSFAQPGILDSVPRVGRFLSFSLSPGASELPIALQRFADAVDGKTVVAALGPATLAALGVQIAGLREFPVLGADHVQIPSTPTALWCWLRGDDAGELVWKTQHIVGLLQPAFVLHDVLDGFRYGRGPNGHGLDLTGYEDGTENPQDAAARTAALVSQGGPGLEGSSFVAVQQWEHDLNAFSRMSTAQQDAMFGRRRADNEEIDDAPASAHVKRTAQESFTPEAFVVRRSMPWTLGGRSGLVFVAFGHSLDAYEALLRRMAGLEDGIVDGLFQISRPLTGAYAWVPPMHAGRLDLRALGF